MNINSLPQDIRLKIKKHMRKISTLSSTDLLEYSKGLKGLIDEIGETVVNYLLKSVHLRTLTINSGLDVKQECKQQKMIKDFMKNK